MNDIEVNSAERDPRFDPTEQRIIGTLIEKALATPEAYPLTLNALVNGCNQKSNRNPVTALEAFEIEGALRALQLGGWVKTVDRHGGRTARYGHRIGEVLGLGRPEQALLAEVLVRGPQTVNELGRRITRMDQTLTQDQVEACLQDHASGETPLFRLLPRQPGERYARWRHVLAGEVAGDETPPAEVPSTPPVQTRAGGDLVERLEKLEARVARLESALDTPRDEVPEEDRPDREKGGWLDVD